VTTSHRIHPILKNRVVPIDPEQAFELFTARVVSGGRSPPTPSPARTPRGSDSKPGSAAWWWS